MRRMNIAIDGPAGAGKSTVARLTANRLDFKYIDTGAMYRAVTWKVLERQIPLHEHHRIAHIADTMELVLETTKDGTKVYVDGEDVTEDIRSERVTANVSEVAKVAHVREILVDKQRQMALCGGTVMDGRDIGTNVLPDAEVKVFLTASITERAQRRFREWQAKGVVTELEKIKQEIAARDDLDSNRSVSPLKKAPDAVVIDTTGLSIEQVVEKILELSRTKIGKLG